MAVVRPIKLTIKNYPKGKRETVIAENNPEDNMAGNREIPFSESYSLKKKILEKMQTESISDLHLAKKLD